MNLNFQHYIFDLDKTLYSPNLMFFDLQLNSMSKFMVDKLNITMEEANILREEYYHDFGTTMHGLMHKHGIDPKEFLAATDNVPLDRLIKDDTLLNLLSMLKTNNKHLAVLTNGSRFHTRRVMKKLGVDKIITDVATLECMNFVPKPDPASYKYCFDTFNIDPKLSVFFEDSSHNLVPAKKYGVTTVLVNAHESSYERFFDHPEIDYLVQDITAFLQGNFLETRVQN